MHRPDPIPARAAAPVDSPGPAGRTPATGDLECIGTSTDTWLVSPSTPKTAVPWRDADLAAFARGVDSTLPRRLEQDPEAYLELIAAANAQRRQADRLLDDAVASARHAGCTWQSIGRVLGTTRQAAQQGFGSSLGRPGAAAERAATRVLEPLTTFTEMEALARAGRHGWHSVGYGPTYHVVEHDTHQWEHCRTMLDGRPEGEDWAEIGHGRAFWHYWARRLDALALPGDPSAEERITVAS